LNQILIVSDHGQLLADSIRADASLASVPVKTLVFSAQLFAQLAQNVPSLLLIDVACLKNTAEPFWSEISKTAPDTVVVVLANAHQRLLAVEQLEHGALDYLLLPITPPELVAKVNHCLEFTYLKRDKLSRRPENFADDTSTLNHITQKLLQTIQLDQALDLILSESAKLAQADVSKIWLVDQAGNLRRSESVTQSTLLPNEMPPDDLLFSLAEQSALAGHAISQRHLPQASALPGAISTFLLITLFAGQRLVGVLVLGLKQQRSLPQNQLDQLNLFCQQAAFMLENARLFHNLSLEYDDLAQSRDDILRSRNTLQAVFDGVTDGLYILNRDLVISAVNQVEAERLGYAADELAGRGFLTLPGPKSAPALIQAIRAAIDSGQEKTWQAKESSGNRYVREREFRIYPVQNRLLYTEQVIIFAQDVSERQRWQASLFRSANLAAVGQLAGNVAHQINNPLTVTMTNSQILMQDYPPDTEVHDLAQGIFKASDRMRNIVANLLEFSNQETYHFVETNLVDTIEGALALVNRSMLRAGIEVEKDYQLQPLVRASVSHLKLVWVNLLLNARDAVIDHAAQPKISISVCAGGEESVRVRVTDNGVGLAGLDLAQMARPFFSTKLPGKALGLGLYSAYTIVEQHSGQLLAYTDSAGLTTFEVVLPLETL